MRVLQTRRFIFTWPAGIAEQCRILNATGTWRHGSVTYPDGYQLNESFGAGERALTGAADGVAAELRAQGIEYSVVFGTYEV
jgi:hypothetical protein